MIKLIFGEEKYSINKFLNTISNNPVVFDESDSLDNMILEISNTSLFNDVKNIIIRNMPAIKDKALEVEFIEVLKTISDNDLIVFAFNLKLLPKNELISFLKTQAKVHEFKALNSNTIKEEIIKIVSQNGGTISPSTAYKLQTLLPNNLLLIESEIKKLLMFNNEITPTTINTLLSKYLDDDFFALSNAIVSGSTNGILEALKDKVFLNVSGLSIVAQISQTLTLALRVHSLKLLGLSDQELADKIGIHIFRIKKSNELTFNFSLNKIRNIIMLLAKIDLDIKTGFLSEENLINYLTIELLK